MAFTDIFPFFIFLCLGHIQKVFPTTSIPNQGICRLVLVSCIEANPAINTFTIFNAFEAFNDPALLEDLCDANDDVERCALNHAHGNCYSMYVRSRYRFFSRLCHPPTRQLLFEDPERRRCWQHPFHQEAERCYRRYQFPHPTDLPLMPTVPFRGEVECFPSLDPDCRHRAAFHLYHWVVDRNRLDSNSLG